MAKNIKIENEVYQDIDIISVESADTAGARYNFIDEGNLQESKNITIRENGSTEITPDSGFTAIKKVNVATDVNQAVEETIINTTENGTNIITPSEGYLGYNKVTINTNVPNQVEEKSVSITANGTTVYEPTSPNIGIKKLTVSTNVPSQTPNLQTKTVSITKNGTTNITPDSGYDGLSSVTANVNVQSAGNDYYLSNATVLNVDTSYSSSPYILEWYFIVKTDTSFGMEDETIQARCGITNDTATNINYNTFSSSNDIYLEMEVYGQYHEAKLSVCKLVVKGNVYNNLNSNTLYVVRVPLGTQAANSVGFALNSTPSSSENTVNLSAFPIKLNYNYPIGVNKAIPNCLNLYYNLQSSENKALLYTEIKIIVEVAD